MSQSFLTRNEYRDIKKYEKEKMEVFLQTIYRQGFKDGAEVGDNADFRIRLSEVLNKTKGIGIVLYDRIMENAKEME